MLQYFWLLFIPITSPINLDYLDPTKLQTKTPPEVQIGAAIRIISKYVQNVTVNVDPTLFHDSRDVALVHAVEGWLHIRASSGVAAVWGFHYYFKKYCRGHIGWQVSRIPPAMHNLPEAEEILVASNRFRYYQNVCTVSYSFVWWDAAQWLTHVEWMALNGINMALAPIAQEYAWMRVYRRLGLTQAEIERHFTGPAYLSWFRMGYLRGWGGPLLRSWHKRQRVLQNTVIDFMFQLGMIPVLPAFNGFVPPAFLRIYPRNKFHIVSRWKGLSDKYCCPIFINPRDPLFITVGQMFLKEITVNSTGHIYNAEAFNDIRVTRWSTDLVAQTSNAIFTAMLMVDNKAVWLLRNSVFIADPIGWPKDRVKAYLTAVPQGRLLVLDVQSEHDPKFQKYDMYFGQPFVWCMLHNFGGNLGMYGNTRAITTDVYKARRLARTTMVGIGVTPEGINQNYVMYDLMLEASWRKGPVFDVHEWAAEYAERRYGCNYLTDGWRHLMLSVYNYTSYPQLDGQTVIILQPSLKYNIMHWYSGDHLIDAFKNFIAIPKNACNSPGFIYDLVDVTRQMLQFKAEQAYDKLKRNFYLSNVTVYNASIEHFLDLLNDIEQVLSSHEDFSAVKWFAQAKRMSSNAKEKVVYLRNARCQVTLWGPNGFNKDYAGKQWAELFHYYYIPRWSKFLQASLNSKVEKFTFDEEKAQAMVFNEVEMPFQKVRFQRLPRKNPRNLALSICKKLGVKFTWKDRRLPCPQSRQRYRVSCIWQKIIEEN